MTLTYGDRVQETTTTTGTGSYALGGAVTGYQAFSAVVADANTCYYAVTDGTNWEVALGTYAASGNTLARTTILASSNGGSAVSWTAGTKNIWLTFPAAAIALFSPIASNNLLANITGGSALPTGNTLTALIDACFGSTQGDILYRDSAAWKVLAPGTAGQVLESGGAAANPAWASPSGITVGATQSFSAGATSGSVSGLPSTIKQVTINFNGVKFYSDNSSQMYLTIGPSGGVLTSGYTGLAVTSLGASQTLATLSSSIPLTSAGNSTDIDLEGSITLNLSDPVNNNWAWSFVLGGTGGTSGGGQKPILCSGYISLGSGNPLSIITMNAPTYGFGTSGTWSVNYQ